MSLKVNGSEIENVQRYFRSDITRENKGLKLRIQLALAVPAAFNIFWKGIAGHVKLNLPRTCFRYAADRPTWTIKKEHEKRLLALAA